MQKITQKDKKILIILSAVIVIFLYFQFILLPSLKSISKSKSAINDLNIRVNEMNTTRIQNTSMKKKLKIITEEYDASQNKLPINERNPEIEYDIQNMASASNVVVSSVVFGDPKAFNSSENNNNSLNEKGNLIQIPVNVNVVGSSKDNIVSFLSKFEMADRISQIKNASIIVNKEKNNFILSINANYFYVVSKANDEVQYNFNSNK
ncbi:hypothetical protein ACJDT4_17780 [Clostridium neuense]|uniref:Uncharacterized protein n=1 Tax=Clostridium neuense TaxID=1728934 RepID=A0ABW8TIC6_9CLOT